MLIAIPRETAAHEKRVAATPETVKKLIQSGVQVVVQSGAGAESHISDAEFTAAGAHVESDASKVFSSADIIFKVQKPSSAELALIKEGTVLVGFLAPLADCALVDELCRRKISAFSMDMVPRIARAQKLDALSSQSNVAGYKAVLMASNTLGKMMPMLMTAAGTISPAKVFVIGAGVAGLQAIATARRLGAIVEAFDTRPVVKEQVESLGAKFVRQEAAAVTTDAEDKRGYAKELSKDQQDKDRELIAKHSAAADIVITTALIPGKKAPVLITEKTVSAMRAGSVIVDLASDGGGNCELTAAGETVVKHGVTIIGQLNVPSLMPQQSSQLYARNVLNLFGEFFKKGALDFDMNNEIIRDSLVAHQGRVASPALAALSEKK